MKDKEMKPVALRDLAAGEIQKKIVDKRDEVMRLRFQQVSGQLTDPSRLRILRRDIARMETILREQLAAEVPEGEA